MTPLRSFLTPSFRKLYAGPPDAVQKLAHEKYRLFKQDPVHPSLEFRAKAKDTASGYIESLRKHGERVPTDNETLVTSLDLEYAQSVHR